MKLLNARKKLVTLAVASAISGGVMMSAPAQAMNVSQNNAGEVLLYPYYTVKNGFDTVFTVTNTTDKTAIFKIRFREALNSREVRDFNVILSPYDHWGAVVTESGTGALVRTFDRTCTSPMLPGMDTNAARAAAGAKGEISFTNALFTGVYEDGATTDMSRVQEGYFEVILMGLSIDETDTVAVNALHADTAGVDADGSVIRTPKDCATVDAQFLATNLAATRLDYAAPQNVLKGHVTYIDVANGKAIDAEPTAIEDFANVDDIIYPPADVQPNLADGTIPATVNLLNNGSVVTVPAIGASEDAVSMLLMANSVANEYATGAGAATSWVLTFPTKHHYTDAYNSSGTLAGVASSPFTYWFLDDTDAGGLSCETVSISMFNREEGQVEKRDNTNFSPYQPGSSSDSLCYEANVVNFNSSDVFGSSALLTEIDENGTHNYVDTTKVGTAGWVKMTFTNPRASSTANGGGLNGFTGLPVIGFAAIMRDQGSASVNYGSSEEHTYMSTNF